MAYFHARMEARDAEMAAGASVFASYPHRAQPKAATNSAAPVAGLNLLTFEMQGNGE